MKRFKQVIPVLFMVVLLISALCVPALAITESEVEAEVAASGKAAVTGNVLIWFLCAVAFLKVSQKIDSFLATLGVNVGRTGGSLLAEAMIAMRAVTMVVGGRHGGSSAGATAAGKSGASGMAGFFKGGLVGMAGRHITNSAVKTATTQTSAVHTAQSRTRQAAAAQAASDAHINSEAHRGGASAHTGSAAPTGTPSQEGVVVAGNNGPAPAPPTETVPTVPPSQEGVVVTGDNGPVPAAPAETAPPVSSVAEGAPPQEGVILTGGEASVQMSQTENAYADGTVITGEGQAQTHTERASRERSSAHTASERVQSSRFHTSDTGRPTLGGMVFSRSLAAGGSFANDVIGTVARGEVGGSITGDMAVQSLASYMGHAGVGVGEAPAYSDVEIGRGRITGVETPAGAAQGQAFAMYHVDQYTAPSGEFTKVISADGTQWYKQYAQDAVERKPYMAPDDTVAYHEKIVKKLPDPPKHKDRI